MYFYANTYLMGFKMAFACTTITMFLIINAGILLIKEMGDLGIELQDSVNRIISDEDNKGYYKGFLGCGSMNLKQRKWVMNGTYLLFFFSSFGIIILGSINIH
jgi:hypothetical protein